MIKKFMKPIEQLQEILCEVESVEKDVKGLRFGCIVKTAFWTYKKLVTKDKFFEKVAYIETLVCLNWQEEIIWNPLTLKHLMMYCNEKMAWYWMSRNVFEIYSHDWHQHLHIDLDITKELYEQEDKVLLDIINFLKGQLWTI